jgi:hypothetical protein
LSSSEVVRREASGSTNGSTPWTGSRASGRTTADSCTEACTSRSTAQPGHRCTGSRSGFVGGIGARYLRAREVARNGVQCVAVVVELLLVVAKILLVPVVVLLIDVALRIVLLNLPEGGKLAVPLSLKGVDAVE